MKYFIAYITANEKITGIGQWTIWEGKWCKVKHIDGEVALLHNIEYPVRLEYLDRHFKVLRPILVERGHMPSEYVQPEAYNWDIAYQYRFGNREVIIPDEHWMDFLSLHIHDKDFIIKDTNQYGKYTKIAVPYNIGATKVDITRLKEHAGGAPKSGIEYVISALEATVLRNPKEHDDKFKNHELATSAIYHITRNTNLLGKIVPLPIGRTEEQTISDLSEAAAIIICEIDRILRLKQSI